MVRSTNVRVCSFHAFLFVPLTTQTCVVHGQADRVRRGVLRSHTRPTRSCCADARVFLFVAHTRATDSLLLHRRAGLPFPHSYHTDKLRCRAEGTDSVVRFSKVRVQSFHAFDFVPLTTLTSVAHGLAERLRRRVLRSHTRDRLTLSTQTRVEHERSRKDVSQR